MNEEAVTRRRMARGKFTGANAMSSTKTQIADFTD
jgi:hypothetical protein